MIATTFPGRITLTPRKTGKDRFVSEECMLEHECHGEEYHHPLHEHSQQRPPLGIPVLDPFPIVDAVISSAARRSVHSARSTPDLSPKSTRSRSASIPCTPQIFAT